MISVPDSVAFYWADAVNRAAVDVLAGSGEVPGDLTLLEAERFELAGLAARRIKVEYWCMLRALWSATWRVAVREHLPAARLLTYGEHRDFNAEIEMLADPSVEFAWEQRAAGGVFEFPGHGRLFTRAAFVDNEREGELQFYLISPDQTCDVTDGLELGPEWKDDGANRRVTRPGLLPLARADGRIDPEPFAALALQAAAALGGALA